MVDLVGLEQQMKSLGKVKQGHKYHSDKNIHNVSLTSAISPVGPLELPVRLSEALAYDTAWHIFLTALGSLDFCVYPLEFLEILVVISARIVKNPVFRQMKKLETHICQITFLCLNFKYTQYIPNGLFQVPFNRYYITMSMLRCELEFAKKT